MQSKLTEKEYSLIQLFFDVCPQWRELLEEQIAASEIEREYYDAHTFVFFEGNEEATPLGVEMSVPVEIILGQVNADRVSKTADGFRMVAPGTFLVVPDNTATGVRLHFDRGHIKELEIYNLSGFDLDIPDFEVRTYVMFERKLMTASEAGGVSSSCK